MIEVTYHGVGRLHRSAAALLTELPTTPGSLTACLVWLVRAYWYRLATVRARIFLPPVMVRLLLALLVRITLIMNGKPPNCRPDVYVLAGFPLRQVDL